MRNIIISFYLTLILTIVSCFTAAENYTVKTPSQFLNSYKMSEEKVLFIMDYSASMTDKINGKTKQFLMLETMRKILPQLNPKMHIGLRVYGHRAAITQYDGCRASSLVVPVQTGSAGSIELAMSKTKARGLTPITYSLKKAVESDFLGYLGKKHIILLTDGGENCDESPCLWAMNLIKTRKDILIDVIAFNIDEPDDIDQLRCTALVTSGKFHSANTSAELVESLKNSLNIKKDVDAKIITNN